MEQRDDLESLLSRGPRSAEELVQSFPGSKKTLYRQLNRLVERGEVLLFPLREGPRWTSLYALSRHAAQAAERCGYDHRRFIASREQVISRAFEELQMRLQREPQAEEVVYAIDGVSGDDTMRRWVEKIGYSRGWRPPTSAEIQEGEQRLRRLIEMARLLKKGAAGERLLRVRAPGEVQRAREFLERFPELVK